MKFKPHTLVSITLGILLLASTYFVGVTAQVNPYDPWVDYNEDGQIDIFDVVEVATRYDTTGDPTKNVNVTNWPTWFWYPPQNEMNITNWPLDENGNLKISLNSTNQPTRHQSVEEITVLEWTDTVTNSEFNGGVYIYQDSIRCLLPFVFSPKGQHSNVTDMWIVITEKQESSAWIGYSISINSAITIATGNTWVNIHALSARTLHIEDNSIHQLINSGINTLEFFGLGSSDFLYLYRIKLFLEYEYLA